MSWELWVGVMTIMLTSLATQHTSSMICLHHSKNAHDGCHQIRVEISSEQKIILILVIKVFNLEKKLVLSQGQE
jgi:hypothetical protein